MDSKRILVPGMTALVIVCWLFICHLSRNPGSTSLPVFLGLSAVMIVATVLVIWRYHKLCQKFPFKWILITAMILRLLSLYGEPLFEDDHYRYMWDGYQTATTNDPYTLAPAEYFDLDVPVEFEPILSLINYPEIATVYGPVAQWVFALGYWIDAAEIWPLQILAGMADLLILLILWRLGAGNALLLYAWSPLLLKEFSLTAHPDIYAILALMLAVFSVKKQWPWLAGIALGLGFGAKVFTLLALPYLLSSRWSLTFWASMSGAFLATLLAITLWFGSYLIWLPEGLLAMADSWLFNAGLYLLLLQLFDFQTIKIGMLAVFVGYGLVTFYRRLKRAYARRSHSEEQSRKAKLWSQTPEGFRGDWLFLVFLLALPVINPWYVAWLMPFAALYPRYWSWGLSFCCLLSYWYGSNAGQSGPGSLLLPTYIITIEYTAVILIALVARIATRQHTRYRQYARA